MNIKIGNKDYNLEALVTPWRQEIWVGRTDTEVYNVVELEDGDVFQCTIRLTESGWLLTNGQLRTECPKGIRSDRQHACSLCHGCCVNVRQANPRYVQRVPERATLVNGVAVNEEGVVLREGDVVSN